jgi:hypothetical protein
LQHWPQILRELHSDIELMLTNCRKSEKKVRKNSDRKIENKLNQLVDVGDDADADADADLLVTDSDTNFTNVCVTLEKAFRFKTNITQLFETF